MARPAPSELDEDTIPVLATIRFPVELTPPDGFDPERLETWPRAEGRLEWVGGRLLYMPPCGDQQQLTVTDVVGTLFIWMQAHPEFLVGTNEAGIRLGEDTRAADAAVWRRADYGLPSPGLTRVAPLLAVEVGGRDEGEGELRDKARWYLHAGVPIVWLVLPREREVIVIRSDGENRHRTGDRLPVEPRLPDLTPAVDDLFRQLSTSGA
jgi:Uma2 family endonuclease